MVSLNEIHHNAKNHLAMGKVTQDAESGEMSVDTSRIRGMANDDENLALTNQPLNGSKSDEDMVKWAAKERKDGRDGATITNAEKFAVDDALMKEKYQRAKQHIDSTANHAMLKNRRQNCCRPAVSRPP
ncbi:hypothetical protein O0544_02520 [Edwardsiella anguillarum]|nr:hypothetical protein [Edwardsiella anguillarum]